MNTHHSLRRQDIRPGFTVIEVLVASVIALIIFAIGFNSISTAQKIQSQSVKSLRLAENARLFFTMVERDLASAYPAWSVTRKQDMVVIDSPTAKSDVLQFFARTDSIEAAPDAIYVIRYYAAEKDSDNKIINQLRRNIKGEYLLPASPVPGSIIPASADLDNYAAALFDEVHSVRFLFRKWDPNTKSFTPSLDDPIDLDPTEVSNATHLLVRLFMKDDGRGNLKESGVVLPRMFQKAIPLPGAFTE